MTNVMKTLLLGGILAASTFAAPIVHAREVKVAVTDLAYEEKVKEYFREIKSSSKSSLRASGHEDAYHSSGRVRASPQFGLFLLGRYL